MPGRPNVSSNAASVPFAATAANTPAATAAPPSSGAVAMGPLAPTTEQEIVSNIQSLKKLEADLYAELETNSNSARPDKARQDAILAQLQEINRIMNQLYKGLNDFYIIMQTGTSALQSSDVVATQQEAIKLISDELSRADKEFERMREEKNNKMRMSQINTYYTQRYKATTELVKLVVYIAIPLLILAFLSSKGMLPESLIAFFTIIIITIGLVKIGNGIWDLMRRRDDNFDEYDFTFDPNNIDKSRLMRPSSNVDLSAGYCMGPACCSENTQWNPETKLCDPLSSTGAAAQQAQAAAVGAARSQASNVSSSVASAVSR